MKKLILIMVLGVFITGAVLHGGYIVDSNNNKKAEYKTMDALTKALQKFAIKDLGDFSIQNSFSFIIPATRNHAKLLAKNPIKYNIQIDDKTKFYKGAINALNSSEMLDRMRKGSNVVVTYDALYNRIHEIVDARNKMVYSFKNVSTRPSINRGKFRSRRKRD